MGMGMGIEVEGELDGVESEFADGISDETAMSWGLCVKGSSFVVSGCVLVVLYILGGTYWHLQMGKILFILGILGSIIVFITWYFHFRKISRGSWKLLHQGNQIDSSLSSSQTEKIKAYSSI